MKWTTFGVKKKVKWRKIDCVCEPSDAILEKRAMRVNTKWAWNG